MSTYSDDFKEKKITILGLGLLGRGVGDAEFFAQCGAQVLVTDMKSEKDLKESVERLQKYPNITFRLGTHKKEDFTTCDIVIKAAGVKIDSPEIAAAKAAGVPVYMSTALFAKYASDIGATIVGITGTRGKSTVTHMIYHALTKAGRRVFLGGNVRGVSTLALLPQVQAGDCAVLELDSWQLQGFGTLGISPHVAVFTNLQSDHQNYYPDMEAYFADKACIFNSQKAGDTLIAGSSIIETIASAHPPVPPIVPSALPQDWQLKIPGEHNRGNASLAAQALQALGLSDAEIKTGIESFEGVEGRLQLVKEVAGVKIYNDNNATTPEATLAALRALHSGEKNIVLIMGGADKGLDVSQLVREMNNACKKVVLLPGSGTSRLVQWFNAPTYMNLQAAVREAMKLTSAGDVLLFSPGFASFGMFKNEYERNDQFLKAIESL